MRVSGFTIVRNAVEYGYPAAEAIASILPLCDELIVNCGVSEDGTAELVRSLGSPKIRLVMREWDMEMRKEGKLLSVETNHALRECDGDWCFYIQADEVLHEKFIPAVRSAMDRYIDDQRTEGLQFTYRHFYGSYDYVQDNFRQWYLKEVRIIKNRRGIVSWGDAMGFKHSDGTDIHSRLIPAEIYHYGWVRPLKTMGKKRENFEKLYHPDTTIAQMNIGENIYPHLGHLVRFHSTHPAVMHDRIAGFSTDFNPHIDEQYPRWLRYVVLFFEPLSKRIRKLFSR